MFIPFASFVMPYRVVADLYRRMLSTARPGDASVAIVVIWWLCFLGQGFLGRISAFIPATTFASLRESVSLSLASSTVELAAAVLAIVIVRPDPARRRQACVRARARAGGRGTNPAYCSN